MNKQTINWYPLVIILLAAALIATFAALVLSKARAGSISPRGENADIPVQQQFHWKMVTSWPKNTPGLGTSAEKIAQVINEMSNGRLQIHVYGANELVPALGVFDAVSSGSVEMGHAGAYFWRGKVPAAQFFTSIPFGMNAQEQNAWLFHGGGLELWREVYAPFNLIPFPGGNTGVQMAGWFNREINSVADLRGLKMRIPGLAGEVFNAAGGTSVNIPGGELYTALQTGVIDAAEWVGPENDLAFGFHQIAKYYYYPGWHEPAPTLELIVNKTAFEKLPKDLQAIVTWGARAVNQDMLDSYTTNNSRALKSLEEKGVQVRRLPDEVLKRYYEIAQQVYAAQAAKDPLFKKVYDSYKAFMKDASPYQKISEQTYYEVREKLSAE
ncbi:TRAP transporter substrate-binding protein [Cellvibrio japonicus]|uniref:Extracellular solute-binding protein, family 7 n=1 Tax=Cellvibrio japonicus (strain Ueda107) TaxID=498211 RepID=B3PGX2_CELJU|nr:TRAP transporter substrate-binding protein [Cellvibrio japonicus]ACE83087.1 extracellular solute-binding protein, family 7 [Cellvibrio japonicus Ueda107]QEI13775.1 TRAP transporter substrate-binding protein [Cellvibrio japonicus]QEI17349.1 TRAP transporter substrate-binding protein [Cellvibrio japonicus]QEI20925.1 TRAP transporter substrate-binding protein [Cellvibrio japonicus]